MTAKDRDLAELEHRFWMQRELTLLWIETMKPRPIDQVCAICGCVAGEHGGMHGEQAFHVFRSVA